MNAIHGLVQHNVGTDVVLGGMLWEIFPPKKTEGLQDANPSRPQIKAVNCIHGFAQHSAGADTVLGRMPWEIIPPKKTEGL